MKIQPYATILALSMLANGVAAHPRGTPEATAGRTIHVSNGAAALRGFCDMNLESLRAGRTDTPTLLATEDRAELRAAESRSADLEDLRAGEFTDREWTMIAVGALIVLVIILIV